MKLFLIIFSVSIVTNLWSMDSIQRKNVQLKLEWVSVTFENKSYNNYQEDTISCNETEKGNLFGVYDGHGSGKSDENVSTYLKNNFYTYFMKSEKDTIKEKFEDVFDRIEKKVLKNYNDGSTAVVAYVDEDCVLHLAWVGDSRVVVEKNGKVAYETKDHTVCNKYEVERLKDKGINFYEVQDDRGKDTVYVYDEYVKRPVPRVEDSTGIVFIKTIWLSMSRSIGDKDMKGVSNEYPLGDAIVIATPEYHKIQLTQKNNFMILATDGLWADVGSNEALSIVFNCKNNDRNTIEYDEYDDIEERKTKKCDDWALFAVRDLINKALKKGCEDNIGIVLVQFKWNKDVILGEQDIIKNENQ